MKRSLKDYVVLGLKGMAMGAADLVPGVSGGTIAFISGIYEELLNSINSINLSTLKTLRKEGLSAAWKSINGNFLLTLFIGIAISVISLAKLISSLINHPKNSLLVWGFFFGLIVSSIWLVGKKVKKWDGKTIIALIAGACIAYYITILPPTTSPEAHWFMFLSGAIAICAMILPGISGSFILLLMGSYQTIMKAISDSNYVLLVFVALGCAVGLLSFSRVLSWMFKKFHNITISILTGFLIGSLNKIWPWKITLQEFVKHKGTHEEKIVPLVQENVLPRNFPADPQIVYVSLLALLGFTLLLSLSFFERKKVHKS